MRPLTSDQREGLAASLRSAPGVGPSRTRATPQAALPSLRPDSGNQMAVQVDNRTDNWTAEVGDAGSSGPLDVTVVCIGGGELTITYGSSRSTVSCDGQTQGLNDEAVPRGAVTVAIHPDGAQRWSARVARGPRVSGP